MALATTAFAMNSDGQQPSALRIQLFGVNMAPGVPSEPVPSPYQIPARDYPHGPIQSHINGFMRTMMRAESVHLEEDRIPQQVKQAIWAWVHEEQAKTMFYAHKTDPESGPQWVYFGQQVREDLLSHNLLPNREGRHIPLVMFRAPVGHPHSMQYLGVDLVYIPPRAHLAKPGLSFTDVVEYIRHGTR